MEKLERLAAQLAHEFDHLIVPANEEEFLETANLVSELADELTAWRQILEQQTGAPAVLVVEPDGADRAGLRELLTSLGHVVLEAAYGAEALDLCGQYEGPISSMLTNILMPDMSGRELAERAALLRPDMAVIYMSGYTDEEIISYGVLGPGALTLEKPIQADALVRRLAQVRETQLAIVR